MTEIERLDPAELKSRKDKINDLAGRFARSLESYGLDSVPGDVGVGDVRTLAEKVVSMGEAPSD